ncbi:MAG TPA: hypothetical protein VNV87_18575, partial [Acidimicrobiales bacterium]|nr:hypothetical protein [Acidimicrobiales bacterium]
MHQHSIGKRRRWRARTVSVAAGIVLLAAGMVSFAAVSPADGAPPPTLTVTGVPVSIPESSAFSGPVATFIDSDPSLPASDFTATIAWGDGTTTPGAIAGSSGNFTVTGTHTYADEGSFAVGVTVTDTVNSVTGSASPTATV